MAVTALARMETPSPISLRFDFQAGSTPARFVHGAHCRLAAAGLWPDAAAFHREPLVRPRGQTVPVSA